MPSTSVVVLGLLKADGTLELDHAPELPAGPVQVTLQVLPETPARDERLPDPPLLDTCVSVPFDLPYAGSVEIVTPQPVAERLPDPFIWEGEDDE